MFQANKPCTCTNEVQLYQEDIKNQFQSVTLLNDEFS